MTPLFLRAAAGAAVLILAASPLNASDFAAAASERAAAALAAAGPLASPGAPAAPAAPEPGSPAATLSDWASRLREADRALRDFVAVILEPGYSHDHFPERLRRRLAGKATGSHDQRAEAFRARADGILHEISFEAPRLKCRLKDAGEAAREPAVSAAAEDFLSAAAGLDETVRGYGRQRRWRDVFGEYSYYRRTSRALLGHAGIIRDIAVSGRRRQTGCW